MVDTIRTATNAAAAAASPEVVARHKENDAYLADEGGQQQALLK